MGKAPDAFRTISEVSALLETPAHVLRFWESKFPQIKPVKRAGGRRYYRPDDIALLGGIKVLLHDQGVAIRGVQKLLREQGARHVAGLSPMPWDGDGSSLGGPELGPVPVPLEHAPGAAPPIEAAEPEAAMEPEVADAPSADLGAPAALPEAVASDAAPAAPPAAEADATAGSFLGSFIAGTLHRMREDAAPNADTGEPTPAAPPAVEDPVAHVLWLLQGCDRDRLRGRTDRIAPLVRRLAALCQGPDIRRP